MGFNLAHSFRRSQTGRVTKTRQKKIVKQIVVFSIREEITTLHFVLRFELCKSVAPFSLFGVFQPCKHISYSGKPMHKV